VIVLGVTAVVTVAMEEVKKWARQQKQIGCEPQGMRPVFPQDKERNHDCERDSKQ
jgi:hypothetical protein